MLRCSCRSTLPKTIYSHEIYYTLFPAEMCRWLLCRSRDMRHCSLCVHKVILLWRVCTLNSWPRLDGYILKDLLVLCSKNLTLSLIFLEKSMQLASVRALLGRSETAFSAISTTAVLRCMTASTEYHWDNSRDKMQTYTQHSSRFCPTFNIAASDSPDIIDSLSVYEGQKCTIQ